MWFNTSRNLYWHLVWVHSILGTLNILIFLRSAHLIVEPARCRVLMRHACADSAYRARGRRSAARAREGASGETEGHIES